MNRLRLVALLTAAVATASAQAGLVVWDTYWNFDVVNNTGGWPNDFHVELMNVSPDQVSNYYCPDGWTAADSGGPGVTNVDWTDSTGVGVAPGETAHFGMGFDDNPNFSCSNMSWTHDGGYAGSALPVRSKWIVNDFRSSTVDGTVWNDSPSSAIWIKRRVNTSGTVITLDDLQVTDPLWITGTWIDASPIRLLPGTSSSVYTWTWQADILSYLLMYEIYTDINGNLGVLDSTSLTGAVVVPEPTAGWLLVGLVGLARLRRKR